ncbi:energy-coupling factor transporter ATPase [Tenuibacillus multivorans]|uniref:Energy-coupling factor transport system ATP-binding protein n=1 Tax=Tenuibacillus multivorans TaxID=237069 RepID=A0A1H0F7M1_9BACI|nr:energy-coupling factor transporter ATPase [Tenuibacillus multivorans]GEL78039.1 energy-coupling factor transporter ATP-binding protein EcfA1 [Tenuibacillus multivorans]SDN90697.1 energy-coupling factor transport system ATP-binding protein [Tenuibacillus multivorans]
MIEFQGVSYRYSSSEENVLKDINLKIAQGDWVALLGHNGSGKSTLAKLMNGILMPTKGQVFVNGVLLNEETVWEIRHEVGMVFQNPENQFVGTTVIDDVAFGLENMAIPREEMESRIDESLKVVGMTDYKLQEPYRLSGGQKQRIAIAGVLAMMPQVIIFDEATTMLDPSGRKELLETMKYVREKRDITFVSITHDLNEAVWADRVIVLEDGAIWFEGTPQTLLEKRESLQSTGLRPPFVAQLTDELRKNGITFEQQPLHHKDLVKQLWTLHSKT